MYSRALRKNMRLGEAWYRLGLTNLQLGLGREALGNLLRATDLDPENINAFVALGNVYLYAYLKEKNLAFLSDLEEQVVPVLFKADSRSFDGLRFSAFIAHARNEVKKSIGLFEQANQVKPDQPEVILWLAQELFDDNQPDLAVKYCRELIDKHQTVFQTYDVLYAFYMRTKHPELAEQVLKEKVARNPGQGSYLVELAHHYHSTNRKSDGNATLIRLTSDLKTYPNAHVLAGDFYVKILEFDHAIQEYQQGEKADPKQKSGYQKRIVEVLMMQGKNDKAAQIVADLLKENSKDPEAIAMHADLLLQSRDRSKAQTAIKELELLIAKAPDDSHLHYNLGTAYVLAGDDPVNREQARLHFEKTVKLEPRHIPAKTALAELALKRGDNGKAVQTSEEVLELQKNNPDAALIRSEGLINMGEHEKARAQLNDILTTYPRFNDARYWLGRLDLMQRRFKDAEYNFDTLKNANDPRGLRELIEVKVGESDFDGALRMVRDQLRQTPGSAEYQLVLANVEYQAHKWADAANDFQKLIDKNPKSVDLYIRLGETKRQAGDLIAAVAAFTRAHQIAPNDIRPMLQIGMLYDTSGNNEEARKAYKEVLKLQPDNEAALNSLAYAMADDGVDLDQALIYAQRAQQKLPNDPDVVDTLSLVYIRKNMTNDSIRLLEELVSQNSERSTYHLHLAMAYYQRGDRAAAKKHLDAAAHGNPSEKEQARIKEMLAKVG